MRRREFLKMGAGGLTGIIAGGCGPLAGLLRSFDRARPTEGRIDLSIVDAMVEMVDGLPVYHWVWADGVLGPSLPGPVIVHEEGYELTVTVTNTLDEEHAFALVSGPDPAAAPYPPFPTISPAIVADGGAIVPGTETGPIPPGGTASVTFKLPAAGTYMYLDPLNAPVNRALGLHGMLISLPETPIVMPYTDPTPAVRQLFADLGTTDHFPGQPWNPERTWLWIFFSIDPKFNARVEAGEILDPAEFKAGNLPRYFMINGKTGFFAAHDPRTVIHGYEGNPALIRMMNAGMASHSPHIHGIHFLIIGHNNVIQDNVLRIDTMNTRPLEIVDALHPFIKPPDIPPQAWPPVQEPFPLKYPMHCHMEMSQTAAGGNYPQGLVTDWELLGPLGGIAGGPDSHEGDLQHHVDTVAAVEAAVSGAASGNNGSGSTGSSTGDAGTGAQHDHAGSDSAGQSGNGTDTPAPAGARPLCGAGALLGATASVLGLLRMRGKDGESRSDRLERGTSDSGVQAG